MAPIKDVFVKVKFNKDKGPITVEVTSGFCTLGTFILAYTKIGGLDYAEFGKDPKRIDDNIPDIFLIPINVDNIKDYVVYIIGKYMHAPGRTQVKVKYDFIQDGKLLVVEPSERNLIDIPSANTGYLRFTHYFCFEEENGGGQ